MREIFLSPPHGDNLGRENLVSPPYPGRRSSAGCTAWKASESGGESRVRSFEEVVVDQFDAKVKRGMTVAKCRHDVESAGGIYVDAPCVVDGNLVSGRTYHDNGRYLGPWIEQLLYARSGAASPDKPPAEPVG